MKNSLYSVIDIQPDFVVISKAAGASFHSESGMGVFEQVKQDLALDELYPVHRLDKVTSGLLVMAKNKATATALGEAFAGRDIEKYYLALSDTKPNKKQGLIKGDMESARRGSYKLLKRYDNPAITQFFSTSLEPGLRLFLLKPHTGKTHQLRVAMKSLSAPILGDVRYAGSEADRTYLHAWSLSFTLAGQHWQYRSLIQAKGRFEAAREVLAGAYADPGALSWPRLA